MWKCNVLVFAVVALMHAQSSAQSWQWAVHGGEVGNARVSAHTVDAMGSSYVAGTFSDSIKIGSTVLFSSGVKSAYVAKADAAGNFLWARIAASDSAISVSGINVDAAGNIVVGGQFLNTAQFGEPPFTKLVSSGSYDVFVAKYSGVGDLVWVRKLDGVGIDNSGGVSSDQQGNIYTTGDLHISVFPYSSSKIFVAKFSEGGTLVWLNTEQNNGFSHFANSIVTDAAGNSYVTGDFFNTIKFSDTDSLDAGNVESNGFLTKFDATGKVLYSQKVGAASGYCVSKFVTADALGNAYITGSFHGAIAVGPYTIVGTSGMGHEVFVAKCNASGQFEWVNKSVGLATATGICIDPQGRAVITGAYNQPIGLGTYSLTSLGSNDVFVAGLNALGEFAWAVSAGGPNNDYSVSVVPNSSGVLVTGNFNGIIQFGPTVELQDSSAITPDIFIAQLSTITNVYENTHHNSIPVFPNPCTDKFFIRLDSISTTATISLLGADGTLIHTQTETNAQEIEVNTGHLQAGVYLLRVTTDATSNVRKIVVLH
ncbi:MAG: T9SS type A sorting domain-containing protein [Ignavibacteria bacterium]|nr:T9SS type A sorting domain-containing protein [Ignavibacteria bacterium]